MRYREMTTEQLIRTATWVNSECYATAGEKAKAIRLIKKELRRRFDAVLEFIDDGQNDTNPQGTIDYLMRG